MSKTAIIIGATGLVGGKLLRLLLQDSGYSKVKLFSRSPCHISDSKIEEHLVNLFELEQYAVSFTGDVVFCCIGTTKAKTPDKDRYRSIDYGIPLAAATLAKRNAISTFEVISTMGAHPESRTFYTKVKGEMERDVLAVGVTNTYIFQPSLLGGDREENRFGERVAQFFLKTFSILIPKQYKIIAPETIAVAMLKVAETGYSSARIPSNEIQALGSL